MQGGTACWEDPEILGHVGGDVPLPCSHLWPSPLTLHTSFLQPRLAPWRK